MRALPFALLLVLVPPTPALPTAGASLCTPAADAGVTEVGTPAMTLYLRMTSVPVRPPTVYAPMVRQVWREENGIPGLQENSEMACGAAPDFEWIETGF